MKNNEEFRASVYARAEREKERIATRRQKRRNASLSVAMVLLVAALAVPLARGRLFGPESFTVPETEQVVIHIPNQAAPVRVMLLPDTQAVVVENQERQKDFADQCKAAIRLDADEDLPIFSADPRVIRSAEELAEFLTDLFGIDGAVTLDYDEAFFQDNILYAMPMELLMPPETAPAAEVTPARETDATRQPTTIPDSTTGLDGSTIPDGTTGPDGSTIPDGTTGPDGSTGSSAEASVTEAGTTAGEPTSMAMQSLPEGKLLLGSGVKVLLLVPENKGSEKEPPGKQ